MQTVSMTEETIVMFTEKDVVQTISIDGEAALIVWRGHDKAGNETRFLVTGKGRYAQMSPSQLMAFYTLWKFAAE